MKTNFETIEGVRGQWRPVYNASQVYVGQYVRYRNRLIFGYNRDDRHKITAIFGGNVRAESFGDMSGFSENIFNGSWTVVEAWFPPKSAGKTPAPVRTASFKIRGSKGGYFFQIETDTLHIIMKGLHKTKTACRAMAEEQCRILNVDAVEVK
jgi:hypothetical protein